MKFSIIGTGSIAGHFAKCIADIPEADLVAVCSSSAERAAKAGQRFNAPAFSDYDRMFEHARPDIVCICTASGNHLEPTLAAARKGIHVICEKPLEINTQRIDEMIETCTQHGVQLAAIFQNRYSSDYQLLKESVLEGRLGRLISGHAYIKWFRDRAYYQTSPWKGTLAGDGGAALINQGIHTVDLLQDIMGDVSEVYAQTATHLHNIEGEDLAQGLLTFTNAAMGTIVASTALWPGYPERLEIYGERGSICLEGGKVSAWNILDESKPDFLLQKDQSPSGSSDPMAIDYQLHKAQISEILQQISRSEALSIDGREGRKSVAIIEAMYRSAASGEAVRPR